MGPHGQSFDSLGLTDLMGENSISLMTQFVERAVASPPVSAHTNKPFASSSALKSFEQAMYQLKMKFQGEGINLPEFFPSTEVSSLKTKLRNGRNVTLMQGEEEPDLLKETFNSTSTIHPDTPLPCG